MVGRNEEQKTIQLLIKSDRSKFLTVTGRRRVGKTYLIRESLKSETVFEFVGTKNATMNNQLEKFKDTLQFFFKNQAVGEFNSWSKAFAELGKCFDKQRKTRRKLIVFLDEFPWISTDKSNFLSEFSYWWNSWASKKNILVVISGSDTAWLTQNIINNKEGLYNRVAKSIHLEPFCLNEVRQFLKSKHIKYNVYEISQLYMIMGGIPYYLEDIQTGESVPQVINRMCYKKTGILYNEFNNLYGSLFEKVENYLAVVRALSTKWKGLTRAEIIKFTKLTNGGGLTKILENLEQCSFIIKVAPIGKTKRESLYRLVDEFTIFYFNFMEDKKLATGNSWFQKSKTSLYNNWCGYAFENICLRHYQSIAMALGISGIYSVVNSYKNKGSQIDLIFDRADNVINLFEIKFYNDEFTLTKAYAELLRKRKSNFINSSKTKKIAFNTFITTYGVKENEYKLSEVDGEVVLRDLFLQKNL